MLGCEAGLLGATEARGFSIRGLEKRGAGDWRRHSIGEEEGERTHSFGSGSL